MAGLQGRAQAEANVSEEGTAPAHGTRQGWPAGDPDPTGHDSGHQAQPRPRARKRGASSPLPVRKPRSTQLRATRPAPATGFQSRQDKDAGASLRSGRTGRSCWQHTPAARFLQNEF